MIIHTITKDDIDRIAPLVADFRVTLKSFKGLTVAPDIASAYRELAEYLEEQFPMYYAEVSGRAVGYIVCRVDYPTVWVESIFVRENYCRNGIASALFEKAEQMAVKNGQDTIFNYVHPNNDRMIGFLRKHGYTVLNLLEIRKPYSNEDVHNTIHVGHYTFDY